VETVFSAADNEPPCGCDDAVGVEIRALCERLYLLALSVAPIDGAHSTQHFDAGYITAAQTLLEAGFLCERHRREDDDRRTNERLLAALRTDVR
jgi:hypothetical protein